MVHKCSFLFVSLQTLQIIERSLPKQQKIKKDPSAIEKEEMEKIGKVWVSIVRRDMPKHHRNFIAFHRKQLNDAKRFSESCQREVYRRISCQICSCILFTGSAYDVLVFGLYDGCLSLRY